MLSHVSSSDVQIFSSSSPAELSLSLLIIVEGHTVARAVAVGRTFLHSVPCEGNPVH